MARGHRRFHEFRSEISGFECWRPCPILWFCQNLGGKNLSHSDLGPVAQGSRNRDLRVCACSSYKKRSGRRNSRCWSENSHLSKILKTEILDISAISAILSILAESRNLESAVLGRGGWAMWLRSPPWPRRLPDAPMERIAGLLAGTWTTWTSCRGFPGMKSHGHGSHRIRERDY